MSTTATTKSNYLSELDDDDFYDLRIDLRTAYETYAEDSREACSLVLGDHAGFVAALDAAESAFEAHISFRKTLYCYKSFRRYNLLFDGIIIGWVVQTSTGGEWTAYSVNRRDLRGTEICSGSTRKTAAKHALTELAIGGGLGL